MIDGAPRLHGHSDGDVALHAVADALLGAAALGRPRPVLPGGRSAPAGIASGELAAGGRRRGRGSGLRSGSRRPHDHGRPPRLARSARRDARRHRRAGRARQPARVASRRPAATSLAGCEGAGRAIATWRIARRSSAVDPERWCDEAPTHGHADGRQREPFVPLEPGHVRMYSLRPDRLRPRARRQLPLVPVRRPAASATCADRGLPGDLGHEHHRRRRQDHPGRRAARASTIGELADPLDRAVPPTTAALRITTPDVMPRATEHIPAMVELIARCSSGGHAYRTDDGSIFFRIASWPAYGRLARLDPEQHARRRARRGRRVRQGRRPRLRALEGPQARRAGVGHGRRAGPAGLAHRVLGDEHGYLGQTFDIHTGGVDLIFPHHEDEIAQSEAATGQPFVRYWLHCAHLQMGGQKMAKSTGNIERPADMLRARLLAAGAPLRAPRRPVPGAARVTARSPSRPRPRRSTGSTRSSRRWTPTARTAGRPVAARSCWRARGPRSTTALDDDLNISAALAAVFDLVRDLNRRIDAREPVDGRRGRGRPRSSATSTRCWRSLEEDARPGLGREAAALLERRAAARAARDWAASDRLRDELAGTRRRRRGHPRRPALAPGGEAECGRPGLTARERRPRPAARFGAGRGRPTGRDRGARGDRRPARAARPRRAGSPGAVRGAAGRGDRVRTAPGPVGRRWSAAAPADGRRGPARPLGPGAFRAGAVARHRRWTAAVRSRAGGAPPARRRRPTAPGRPAYGPPGPTRRAARVPAAATSRRAVHAAIRRPRRPSGRGPTRRPAPAGGPQAGAPEPAGPALPDPPAPRPPRPRPRSRASPGRPAGRAAAAPAPGRAGRGPARVGGRAPRPPARRRPPAADLLGPEEELDRRAPPGRGGLRCPARGAPPAGGPAPPGRRSRRSSPRDHAAHRRRGGRGRDADRRSPASTATRGSPWSSRPAAGRRSTTSSPARSRAESRRSSSSSTRSRTRRTSARSCAARRPAGSTASIFPTRHAGAADAGGRQDVGRRGGAPPARPGRRPRRARWRTSTTTGSGSWGPTRRAASYRDADLRGPLALVVGSEGRGIGAAVHRRLDLAVRIPMRGRIGSLNAAVAGSVLLFEALAQRETRTARPAVPSDAAGALAHRRPAPTPCASSSEPSPRPADRRRGRDADAVAEPRPSPVRPPRAAAASPRGPGGPAEPRDADACRAGIAASDRPDPAAGGLPAVADLLPGELAA